MPYDKPKKCLYSDILKNATEKATENKIAIYKETSTEKAQYKLTKCFIILKFVWQNVPKKAKPHPFKFLLIY